MSRLLAHHDLARNYLNTTRFLNHAIDLILHDMRACMRACVFVLIQSSGDEERENSTFDDLSHLCSFFLFPVPSKCAVCAIG